VPCRIVVNVFCGAPGVNAGEETKFRSIDISDTRNNRLIKQHLSDWGTSASK
jgi:hypothetical protein